MANTKKGGKGSSSKKGSSSSKKKTTSKKGSSVKYVGKNKDYSKSFYELHRTSIMLTYAIVAVILFFLAVFKGYNIWETIRCGLFTFFGVGYYVLILVCLYLTVRIITNNLKRGMIATNLSAIVLVASVSSVVHLFDYSIGEGGFEEWKTQFAEVVSDSWAKSGDLFFEGGGILGGLFGGTLLHSFGKDGAFVVVIATLLASGFILLNLDAESIRNSFLNIKDKYILNKEEKAVLKEERQELHKKEREAKEAAKKQRIEELRTQRKLASAAASANDQNKATAKSSKKAADTSFASKTQPIIDSFDFNNTEIGLDLKNHIQEDELSKNKRELKPVMPDMELFSMPVEIGDASPKKSENNTIDISTDNDSDKPDFFEDISSNDEAFEAGVSEANSENEVIIKDAAQSAKEQLDKTKSQSDNFVEESTPKKEYVLPPIDCLKQPEFNLTADYESEMQETSKKILDTIKSFQVNVSLVGITRGPSVTRYEISPAPGVKISKITGLSKEISLALATSDIRFEAPIPGKAAVGIEVPNKRRDMVRLSELIVSDDYQKAKSNKKKLLTVALGKNVAGDVILTDLSKLPHLLVAGTTGSGKSVCMNCMIASILYNATPSEVKLLMIDPKQVEFPVYNGIPHLLVPVITDVRKAAGSLSWAVSEMENRYKAFSKCGVRDIEAFNKNLDKNPEYQFMPQIVIFIDELNDLMMVSPKEVEDSICRLAQKARAAGMHLVVATQRPSVDVITGLIKANIPSRLALSVSSQVDSRTILDVSGAEKLLGNGDMLFSAVGSSGHLRVQGAFLSEDEIETIVDFIKEQENASYDDDIIEEIEKNATADDSSKKKGAGVSGKDSGKQFDDLLDKAVDIITSTNSASTTALQRKLGIGYARAARIIDELEQLGYVSTPIGNNKGRNVLITRTQYLEMKAGSEVIQEEFDDDFDILSD